MLISAASCAQPAPFISSGTRDCKTDSSSERRHTGKRLPHESLRAPAKWTIGGCSCVERLGYLSDYAAAIIRFKPCVLPRAGVECGAAKQTSIAHGLTIGITEKYRRGGHHNLRKSRNHENALLRSERGMLRKR